MNSSGERLTSRRKPVAVSRYQNCTRRPSPSHPVITTQCVRTVTCRLHRDDWVNALGHEVECALHSVTNALGRDTE